MAKTFYVPVNRESVKPTKWYVPVDGESTKVVKAYCSDNGSSKLFWGEEPAPIGNYVYLNGALMNVTPNASLSDIVDGYQAYYESQGIINKKIVWRRSESQFPAFVESNNEIVTPDLTSYTTYSDMYTDVLCIPIDRRLLITNGADNTPITIRINCKASKSNGHFNVGFIQVRSNTSYHYFSSIKKGIATFGNSQGEYPLDTYEFVDFTLSSNDSYEVRNNIYYTYEGYTYLILEGHANNGVSPILNIKSIEIINQ